MIEFPSGLACRRKVFFYLRKQVFLLRPGGEKGRTKLRNNWYFYLQ
jgi:hypothetical protein